MRLDLNLNLNTQGYVSYKDSEIVWNRDKVIIRGDIAPHLAYLQTLLINVEVLKTINEVMMKTEPFSVSKNGISIYKRYNGYEIVIEKDDESVILRLYDSFDLKYRYHHNYGYECWLSEHRLSDSHASIPVWRCEAVKPDAIDVTIDFRSFDELEEDLRKIIEVLTNQGIKEDIEGSKKASESIEKLRQAFDFINRVLTVL